MHKKMRTFTLLLLVMLMGTMVHAGAQEMQLYAGPDLDKIVGHIANEDDIRPLENKVYITTYYFGDFWVRLPEDTDYESLSTHGNILVVLEEALPPFPMFSVQETNALSIAPIPTHHGTYVARGADYIDVTLDQLDPNPTLAGQTLRFMLTDASIFSRPLQIGETVTVTYEHTGTSLEVLLVVGAVG